MNLCRASLVAQLVKNLPAMQETWVRSLGWKDPLEKGKATHSSILALRIPWGLKESDTTEWLSLSYFHIRQFLVKGSPRWIVISAWLGTPQLGGLVPTRDVWTPEREQSWNQGATERSLCLSLLILAVEKCSNGWQVKTQQVKLTNHLSFNWSSNSMVGWVCFNFVLKSKDQKHDLWRAVLCSA